MPRRMTKHESEGHRRAAALLRRFGSELRIGRAAAGITQHRLGEFAGVSQSFVSLVERGRRRPDWSTACALAAGVGHDLSVRLFPMRSISLRDSGQYEAVQTIIQLAHHAWQPRMEAPVGPGDARAADLLLISTDEVLHVEVERALIDLQAQLRAAQRKRSVLAEGYSRPVRLVIGLPDTRRARAVVRSLEPGIQIALPQASTRVLRSIRSGVPLGADGVLFIPLNA
jgi:transcriptional regulator with XRE-family HTH domain